jgi:hypothetical protein
MKPAEVLGGLGRGAKDKIKELAANSKNKNIRDLHRRNKLI